MIKSGFFIEGVEVTETHIGRMLEVVKSNTSFYPVGFTTPILNVSSGFYELADTDGDLCNWCSEDDNEVDFKWSRPPVPKVKSTPAQRKKCANAIKVQLSVLLATVNDAEVLGVEVCLTNIREGVKITFDPPQEEY
jgi:hypothetical protein